MHALPVSQERQSTSQETARHRCRLPFASRRQRQLAYHCSCRSNNLQSFKHVCVWRAQLIRGYKSCARSSIVTACRGADIHGCFVLHHTPTTSFSADYGGFLLSVQISTLSSELKPGVCVQRGSIPAIAQWQLQDDWTTTQCVQQQRPVYRS